MAKVLTQSQALNLYFESVLWMACPHADKIPDAMLAYVLAACKGADAIDFDIWREACNIEIQDPADDAGVEIGAEAGKPKAEYISPLTELAERHKMTPAFSCSQSEMTEEEILKHNDMGVKVIDSIFPPEVMQKPEEPNNNAAVEHASADRSGV